METQKVTPEQVAAWKEKYGEKKLRIFQLPLDDNGDQTLDVYARVPDNRILSEWEKFSDKNPLRAKEILVRNCILTDTDQVLNDQGLFLSALSALTELIPVRKAIIKNL
jgi:hypothetical protein